MEAGMGGWVGEKTRARKLACVLKASEWSVMEQMKSRKVSWDFPSIVMSTDVISPKEEQLCQVWEYCCVKLHFTYAKYCTSLRMSTTDRPRCPHDLGFYLCELGVLCMKESLSIILQILK